MDRFYAGLAHYVRQAEAGDEVLVTRWGRPVARLVPPAPDRTAVTADARRCARPAAEHAQSTGGPPAAAPS